MKFSYKIFSISGISVKLHITFILFVLFIFLIVVAGFGIVAGAEALIILILLFTCVLAHELSHSIVAKREGCRVDRIILLPFGGLASVDIPLDPKLEFKVSISGPMFNFVLAVICMLLLLWVYPDFSGEYMGKAVDQYLSAFSVSYNYTLACDPCVCNNTTHGNISAISDMGKEDKDSEDNLLLDVSTIPNALLMLMLLNLALGVFNLLPAFPMDGGRIFRSILALRMDYIYATKIAVYVGQMIMIGMILYGMLLWNLWIILIAMFLLMVGGSELEMVKIRYPLKGVKVGDIALGDFRYVSESITLAQFLESVAVPRQRFYPTVNSAGNINGILDIKDLRDLKGDGVRKHRADFSRTYVREVARPEVNTVDAGTEVDKVLDRILGKGFVLVLRSGSVVGHITSNHLADIAKFYRIKE